MNSLCARVAARLHGSSGFTSERFSRAHRCPPSFLVRRFPIFFENFFSPRPGGLRASRRGDLFPSISDCKANLLRDEDLYVSKESETRRKFELEGSIFSLLDAINAPVSTDFAACEMHGLGDAGFRVFCLRLSRVIT